MVTIDEAKKALDAVIEKGRVHLYKPIQVAEILYRDRVCKDIEQKMARRCNYPSCWAQMHKQCPIPRRFV